MTRNQIRLRRKYTRCKGTRAMLIIGVQGFTIEGSNGQAPWYRHMLAIALETLIEKEARR